jgi:hypothetical protein
MMQINRKEISFKKHFTESEKLSRDKTKIVRKFHEIHSLILIQPFSHPFRNRSFSEQHLVYLSMRNFFLSNPFRLMIYSRFLIEIFHVEIKTDESQPQFIISSRIDFYFLIHSDSLQWLL